MLVKNTLAALLGLAVAVEAASVHNFRSPAADGLVRRQNKNNQNNRGGQQGKNNQGNQGQQAGNQGNQGGNQGNNNNNNNNAASVTCLAPNAIQTGSQSTGQSGAVAADGQVESKTDPANFINTCAGLTLTNGLQNRDGSCNGIPMGKIPSVDNMVSTVILFPKNNQVLTPNQDFNISLQIQGLTAGSFTNATSTYYSAPQDVGGDGKIIGHTHVTVQDTGKSLDPTTPLDPKQFVFFKGINDAGNGRGLLQAQVKGGLPEGFFRLCTMSSASNHQPVLMPVAQRGTQEDCKYFAVNANPNILNGQGGNNNNGNNGNAGNANAGNAGNANANAGNANAGNSSNANQGQANQGKGNGGNQGKANGQGNQGQANQGKANQGQANQGQAGGQANQGQANQGQANQGKAQGNQGKASGQQAQGQAQQGQGQAQQGQGQAQQGQGQAQQGQGKASAGGAGAAGAALGNIAAPEVKNVGGDRPFVVNGDSFVNKSAAVQRACAVQNNACANAVNSGSAQGFSVTDCNSQEQACRTAGGA
ncbi:hypothetical protein QBC47DRAFT_145810 [Echria macrotheca]|uniref:Ribosomal protein s17 n=1 Tax=Echria macrotheca TaxID=438768 RepID=A0AAJ0FCQ4_9PEZI|nr:hypothetical protein QBC47DRAFT_145810 [Echria macrotheca]